MPVGIVRGNCSAIMSGSDAGAAIVFATASDASTVEKAGSPIPSSVCTAGAPPEVAVAAPPALGPPTPAPPPAVAVEVAVAVEPPAAAVEVEPALPPSFGYIAVVMRFCQPFHA